MNPATAPTLFADRRTLAITAAVVALHAAALWALNTGLLQRTAEPVEPVTVMAEILNPAPLSAPRPQPAPVQPKATPAKPLARQPVAPAPPPVATPAPAPAPTAAPSPNAPVAQAPAPLAAPAAAPVAAAPAPAAPARVDLPSSDADYLNNPKPAYPAMSRRLGEQGKVIVRVFIGTDGAAHEATIRQSSGYERLDQVALATALKWRYVPGKRGGVPEAMWFNVPINFVLE